MRRCLFFLAICFSFMTAACSGSDKMGGNGDGGGLPPLSDGGPCTAAPDAGMASPATATLEWMEPCTAHEQCKSGLCFNFNMGGARCSAPCTEPCQCEAPSRGCNNMGVCKSP